ncbi:hypothetical protein NPIL_174721 [Nephila pilipes]|uniref:Uncharacterized protein n=1 Tax=Nephila pilipes TaxID=299642 RepID=A0A8X6TG00_NEPPI|nr:hypothetical protein NPIL_174721 [Nephila pilipes]
MLMDISSRLSRLETRERSTSRGPERRFRRRSASRNSGGKLERPSLGSSGGSKKGINRLYLSDRTSKSKYLIDTVADVPVVPLTVASKHHPPASLQFFAANWPFIFFPTVS